MARKINQIHRRRQQRSADFFANNEDALSQQSELICAPEVYHEAVLDIITHTASLGRKAALEVGPGNGQMLKSLAEQFEQTVGMERSTEVIAVTKEILAAEIANKRIRLIERDFLTATASSRYDFILASMVVHHFPSPARFFKQAQSLLRPDGLIVLAELCEHNQEWVQEACGDLWLGFRADQIKSWAERAGLIIRDHQFLAQRNGFRVQVVSMAIQN